jgi:hypothetical protein
MKPIAILALIVLIVLVFGYSAGGPSEPKDYVSNKTYSNYSNILYSYDILRYPSSVEIIDLDLKKENVTLGFVTDSWNINFGVIPGNGTYVRRNIELTNRKDSPSKIELRAYGNISTHVSFSQNDFILNPGDKASIDIYLFSNSTNSGNYTGEIDVIAKKAIYNFFPIL